MAMSQNVDIDVLNTMTEVTAAAAVNETTVVQMTSKSSGQKNKKNSTKTRKSSTVFGIGRKISDEDANINGCRLPTSNQVLRCLMYHLNDGASMNRTRWECAKL